MSSKNTPNRIILSLRLKSADFKRVSESLLWRDPLKYTGLAEHRRQLTRSLRSAGERAAALLTGHWKQSCSQSSRCGVRGFPICWETLTSLIQLSTFYQWTSTIRALFVRGHRNQSFVCYNFTPVLFIYILSFIFSICEMCQNLPYFIYISHPFT